MPYYTPEQVEASRRVLDKLLGIAPGAILIGGWGTWVRCHGPMSHDIDMIIDRTDLAALAPVLDTAPSRNARLGNKQSSEYRGVHVDIYLPYESVIGSRMQLRAEALGRYPDTVDRYTVLTTEAQIVSKMAALLDRPYTLKGQKDRHEIIALFQAGADPAVVADIVAAASDTDIPTRLVADAFDHLGEYEPLPGEGTWGTEDRRWLRDLRRAALPAATLSLDGGRADGTPADQAVRLSPATGRPDGASAPAPRLAMPLNPGRATPGPGFRL